MREVTWRLRCHRLGAALAVTLAGVAGIGAPADALAPDDEIHIGGGVTADVVALVDGRKANGCKNDVSYAGGAVVKIGNFRSPHAECPPEVAVFLPGHAMALLQPLAPWSNNGSDVINVDPQVRLKVPLNVWVVPSAGMSTAQQTLLMDVVRGDLDRATDLYDQNLAGIQFSGTPQLLDAATATTIGDGCMHALEVRMLPAGPHYNPAAINVYYVPYISMPEDEDFRGYYCVVQGAPDIIYVSHGNHSETTLAHELGHVLGLITPYWGHTDDYDGFTKKNLMWGEVETADADRRESFTLGQVYRMNVDAWSWVNRVIGTGATARALRQSVVKVCQSDQDEAWPCPQFREDR